MKRTTREKVLLVTLPSLLIFMIFGWFFFWPKHRELTRAEMVLQEARARAPGLNAQVTQMQMKLANLAADLERLETQKREAHSEWETFVGCCTDCNSRHNRIEKLNKLLARCKLRVVEETEADGGQVSKVAGVVENLGQQVAKLTGKPRPQLRKIKVLGSYLDVLAALEELTTKEVLAIPVGLTMKPLSHDAAVREWVILVWI